jgi:hypothetical protein
MSRQDTDANNQGSMDKNRGEGLFSSETARRFFLGGKGEGAGT